MCALGDFLRKLRGDLSLREAASRSGLSYTYIRSLELGKHPRTGAPINPTPESLKGLAKAYNYDYNKLMQKAGYIDHEKQDYNDASTTIKLVQEQAAKMGLSPSDPVFQKMLSDAFNMLRIARGKNTE